MCHNQNTAEEIFKLEIEVQHKVQAKISNHTLLVSLVEGDYSAHKHVLYIFNLKENLYIGFIKLQELLSIPVEAGRKTCAIDFSISEQAD